MCFASGMLFTMDNILTHNEMAKRMLATVGVTDTTGINLDSKGVVAETDAYAMDNDYHFDGANYVKDSYALGLTA